MVMDDISISFSIIIIIVIIIVIIIITLFLLLYQFHRDRHRCLQLLVLHHHMVCAAEKRHSGTESGAEKAGTETDIATTRAIVSYAPTAYGLKVMPLRT